MQPDLQATFVPYVDVVHTNAQPFTAATWNESTPPDNSKEKESRRVAGEECATQGDTPVLGWEGREKENVRCTAGRSASCLANR